MIRKRICALLLILMIFAGLHMPAAAVMVVFEDIDDQETQDAVKLLRYIGIVSGYEDGTFRPDEKLTRAQFCKMAVMLSETQDVAAYEGFTIFPDVRADHWARGYINTAVRALHIVTGFPDGTFKPDIPVSYAQAVTTIMRLLGYTDSDVGLNWPRSYLDRANQIGLTEGLSIGDNDDITRAESVMLLYNAVMINNKDGSRYYDKLGFKEQRVIVLKRDGTSPDGLVIGLVTLGGEGFYPCDMDLGIEEGSQGTLQLDRDGNVWGWTPDKQTKKDMIVRETGPMSATGTDFSKVDNIPSDAVIFVNGEKNTWERYWIEIPAGLALQFFFNAAGVIDYIFLYQPASVGVVMMINNEPLNGRNPLPALGIDANAWVFKNGVVASWSDLRALDVIIYNADSNTVNASDFRITAVYENGLPNREAPNEVVTLGGKNFEVLFDARAKLGAVTPGDAVTFFFTTDGRVADVRATRQPVYQPGIVISDTSVMLYNGMVVSDDEPLGRNYREGTPVLVCMRAAGKLSLQIIVPVDCAGLDMVNMKADTARIMPYAVYFDLSGTGGRAVQVTRASIPDAVDAAKVLYLNYDPVGNIDLVVLSDVTGDAWIYGYTRVERGRYEVTEITDGLGNVIDVIYTYYPNMVHIENQDGSVSYEDTRNHGSNSGTGIAGVAVGTNGVVLASKTCVRVNNVRRSAFSSDNNTLMVSGILRPIPEGLLVYVQSTKEYITVAEARVYTNNFTVFLDRPAAEGGKPRFIIAN